MARTWFITGSSRGFGRALTEAALAAGDNVVATARNPRHDLDGDNATGRDGDNATGRDGDNATGRDGDNATGRDGDNAAGRDSWHDRVLELPLDVTDPAAAEAAVARAVERFGRIDVVANNAGYGNPGAIEDIGMDDFRAQVEANFYGVVNVTRAALPVLRAQGAGHFLQFSSIGGRVGGSPGMAAYQAAKFAVEGFSEVLNAEVEPLGLKVTIIEPGPFRTDWGGSSMSFHPVSAPYEPTVGKMNAFRRETDGTWPGDPVRAAHILLDVVTNPNPPLRLLLGAAAVDAARKSSAERAAEAEEWAEVSRSADFPA